MSRETSNKNREKRRSQVFIAAQSLNDELKNIKSLKRMSIGSMDDLDTRDMLQNQYSESYDNTSRYSKAHFINEETENDLLIEKQDKELRQNKRLTIDSSQYLDIYDDYNDDNESSEDEDTRNYSYANDSIVTNNNQTTINSIDNSYNATSAEYLNNEIIEQGSTVIDFNNKSEADITASSDEDKEFTSSLLWVPANKHPSIKPEKYLKYVQNKLETLSVDDDQTNNNRSVSRSRSSNIENASVRRRKSFQENEVAGMRFAAKSKSLTRKPSRLRRSFISDDDKDNSDVSMSSNESKESDNKKRNIQNRFSLKEITEELTKMSNNAGLSGNDAVSLARSLSMSIQGQRRHYEDDLEFENDNIYYDEAGSPTDDYAFNRDDDETTSPTSPSAYIMKSSSLDLFLQESEKLKRRKGHYQPSYELELPSEKDTDFYDDDSDDSFKSFGSDDDYVIGINSQEDSKNVGRNVTRAKTIKQVLKQQQKEIERHASKDKKLNLEQEDKFDEKDEYASTFNKQEMNITKGSKIQRSKFNTYRERSYQNKLGGKSALKTANSVDNLRTETQIGLNKSITHKSPSPQFEYKNDNRRASHETTSSGDSQSMHTAEEGDIELPTTPEETTTKYSSNTVNSERDLYNYKNSSSESLASNGSDIRLKMKSSKDELNNNAANLDSSDSSPTITDEGKKSKNKLYNILKKGKFKFNRNASTKKENEHKVSKSLSLDTSLNHEYMSSIADSPKSSTGSGDSPSSPVKLPSFSSKRTLSGTNSAGIKPFLGDKNPFLPTTNDDIKTGYIGLEEALVVNSEKKSFDYPLSPDGYKLTTIEDDGMMSPISPSEINMFVDDFDMSDNEIEGQEQVILESDHEETSLEQDVVHGSELIEERRQSTVNNNVKVRLFETQNKDTTKEGLFKFKQSNTVTKQKTAMLISPPTTPDREDYEDEYQDNLPPRKLTFKDVHRPKVPNSPMKYRDSSFGFPLPPLTLSTIIMCDHRLVVSMERAIYRLSHMKLSENKRELRQQVLLSNFMYSYLNLVNHSLYLQKLEEEGAL